MATGTRLAKQRYREKGPTLETPLLTLPGLVTPAVTLVVMLYHGVRAKDGIPLVVFLLSMGVLLFVWFAPWAQHVRAISQDRNVSISVVLGQAIYRNKVGFLMTIVASLLLELYAPAPEICA